MPNALWVVTRRTNLDGYHSWLERCPEEAKAMGLAPIPNNRILQVPFKTAAADGSLIAADTKEFIDTVVKSYTRRVLAGDLQVDGIVFDEFSVLATRVYQDMSRKNRNGFDCIRQFKDWVAELCEVPVVVEKPMIQLCHVKDPVYDEDTGKLKYKGGPAMPIGTIVGDVCALPDAVLQLQMVEDVTGAVKRVMKTDAHPLWERKCRLWGVPPEMDPDLRKLLADYAGWYQQQKDAASVASSGA